MDHRSAFERFCKEKYCVERTIKSGVMTDERRTTYEELLRGNMTHVDHHLKYQVYKKHQYVLKNDELHQKQDVKGVTKYLKIPSVEEFFDVIDEVHEMIGHQGIAKTYDAIKSRFAYVPREVVTKFVKLCKTCQKKKQVTIPKDKVRSFEPDEAVESMEPIAIEEVESIKAVEPVEQGNEDFAATFPSRPFDICQMGLIDMTEREDEGFRYILTFIDHFTEFVVLRPLPSKTNEEVVSNLRTAVLPYFGLPSILHIVSSAELCATDLQPLIDACPGNCELIQGHPQYKDDVERLNGTVKDMLTSLELQWMTDHSGEKIPWSSWLPDTAYEINTGSHSTIKMSPYECLFGRKPHAASSKPFTNGKYSFPMDCETTTSSTINS